MTLLRKLLRAVPSWRRRRDGPRAAKRADVALEHLDHRQLMSVNFTGNVLIDFPETTTPGVVVLTPNASDPNFKVPQIPPDPPELSEFVKVSGFTLEAIRVTYTQNDRATAYATGRLTVQGPPTLSNTTASQVTGFQASGTTLRWTPLAGTVA